MQKPNLLQIFIYCLLKANHEPNEIIFNNQVVRIERGSFITGRFEIAKDLKMNPASVYKNLQNLQKLSYISLNSNNEFTMLTVLKYNTYQIAVTTKGQQSNNKVTTKEQQSNTNNNDNNDNNEKNRERAQKNKLLCLFENSEFYDFPKFKEKFLSNENYKQYDVKYYYEAVKNWSAGKGEMKKDWIATARNFALKDQTPRFSRNGNVETIKLPD